MEQIVLRLEPSPFFDAFLKTWEQMIEEYKDPAKALERAERAFHLTMGIDVQKIGIKSEVWRHT